jgi:hypothetical protein
MLVVTHNEVLDAIEILCDEQGIEALSRVLTDLRLKGGHRHFYAPPHPQATLNATAPHGQKAFKELIITSALGLADQA